MRFPGFGKASLTVCKIRGSRRVLRLNGAKRCRLKAAQNDADNVAYRRPRALEVARAPVRSCRLAIVRNLAALVIDVHQIVDDHLDALQGGYKALQGA